MSAEVKEPGDCLVMADVRLGVDRADEAIVALLARRFAYMEAAARIKPRRDMVRDEDRKAQVLGNVGRLARERGVPERLLAELYERLVEASIAYELERFDEARD